MSKYAVIDLEMCRISYSGKRKEFGISQELIQIGAVLLGENYEVSDTFMTFVHPEYGRIDSRIEKLTGITNEAVKNAPKAAEALKSFFDWLPEDAVIVSWSDSDREQVYYEIQGKNIELPGFEHYYMEWIDCQYTFSDKMNTERAYKLSEALNICGIDYSDGAHDALVDAKNTAELFVKMEKEDELKLSPYIIGIV